MFFQRFTSSTQASLPSVPELVAADSGFDLCRSIITRAGGGTTFLEPEIKL